MKRRVVITGVGAVSPLGNDVQSTWDALMQSKSGISKITRFNCDDYSTKIAGEVKNFDPTQFIPVKDVKKTELFSQYALAASVEAMKDSNFDIASIDPFRGGVCLGVGIGGLETIENTTITLVEKGPKRVSPFYIPSIICNLAAAHVSIKFGLQGPNFAVVSACTSGTHSIGESFRMIQHGQTDMMICGGSESTITPTAVAGFSIMKALSDRNDTPEKASRPFDKDRDGFVMAEGAGILVLEELEHALKRDAKIYAEVVGYGITSDAFHITQPSTDGIIFEKTMSMALNDAGINTNEVDYINAHGTSTHYNDLYETMAIKRLFKEHAYKLSVSSTKSMTGHMLGAAGGIEAVISAKTIETQVIAPTINLDNPAEECDLDYTPHKPREKKVDVVLSNSFGFGGTNGTIVLRKFR